MSQDGVAQPNTIVNVQYGLNEAYILGLSPTASGKYEAVVTFDSNVTSPGNQALASGQYVLSLSDSVKDQFGNRLDGDYDGYALGVFSLTFTVQLPDDSVNQTTDDVQTTKGADRCVATDDAGDYVVAWVGYSNGQADVYVRLYNADGTPRSAEMLVTKSNYDKTTDQTQPSVAMDGDGDFVVAWTSAGQDPDGSSGIYAQMYNSMGVPVGTNEFRVNTNFANDQTQPSVAMDSFGDFTIVWASDGAEVQLFQQRQGPGLQQRRQQGQRRVPGQHQSHRHELRQRSGRLPQGSQPLGGDERYQCHRGDVDAASIADKRDRHR